MFTAGCSFDSTLFEQPRDILQTDFEDSDGNISIARPSQKADTLSESGSHKIIMVSASVLNILKTHRRLIATLYVQVVANRDNLLNLFIAAKLSEAFGSDVQQLSFDGESLVAVAPGSVVITTLELEEPLLANMTDHQMRMVKRLIENASVLLWVTGGALFKAQSPLFALVLGLARTVMLERPTLKMPVIDLDSTTQDLATSARNVLVVLRQATCSASPDLEFRQQDGVLHISRFIPDRVVNQRFRRFKNDELASESLESAGNCRLNIQDVGQLDTLHFKQQSTVTSELPEAYLEVRVKAIGLNAKVLISRIASRTSTDAFLGLLRSQQPSRYQEFYLCTGV